MAESKMEQAVEVSDVHIIPMGEGTITGYLVAYNETSYSSTREPVTKREVAVFETEQAAMEFRDSLLVFGTPEFGPTKKEIKAAAKALKDLEHTMHRLRLHRHDVEVRTHIRRK